MSHVILKLGLSRLGGSDLCKQSGAMKRSTDTHCSVGTAVAISVDKMLYLCSGIVYSMNLASRNVHSSSQRAYSNNLCYLILLKGLSLNHLTPNDPYRGRTAQLTSKVAFYIQGPPKKCVHTLTKENPTLYNRLLYIYNIFPSTQQYDICIYFNITYIVNLATCFDSYESSSGINIQELLVHIVLQFFMS